MFGRAATGQRKAEKKERKQLTPKQQMMKRNSRARQAELQDPSTFATEEVKGSSD